MFFPSGLINVQLGSVKLIDFLYPVPDFRITVRIHNTAFNAVFLDEILHIERQAERLYHSIGLVLSCYSRNFHTNCCRPHRNDLFENLSVNSLKGNLSKAITFKLPLFSLDNIFR
jgi:hypothetical protein